MCLKKYLWFLRVRTGTLIGVAWDDPHRVVIREGKP